MLNILKNVKLQTVLDNESLTFKPGDTIEGYVLVNVDSRIDCQELLITNRFKAFGKGNNNEQDLSSLVLFVGEWQPGTYRYPFKYIIPDYNPNDMPPSYYGHYINVVWQIATMAWIEKAVNPRSLVTYELLVDNATHVFGQNVDLNPSSFSIIRWIVEVIIFSVMFMLGIWSLYCFAAGYYILGIMWSVLPIYYICVRVKELMEYSINSKFGSVKLSVSEGRATESIKANLSITARKTIEIDKLTAYLILEEFVISGFSSGEVTYTHERVISSNDISNRRHIILSKNSTLSYNLNLRVPEPLIPTVDLKDNKLRHKIKIVAQMGKNEVEWSSILQTH